MLIKNYKKIQINKYINSFNNFNVILSNSSGWFYVTLNSFKYF